jgi:hypothetical protein
VRKRSWLVRTMLFATLLAVVIGVILLRTAKHGTLVELQRDVASYRPIGAAFRLAIVGALVAAGPRLLSAAEKRGVVSRSTALLLQQARWRLFGWFVTAEFLIGIDLASVVATRSPQ